jgi:RNA polymerase sigma-54 factor
VARFIGENLNPFPGRAHWGDIHHASEAAQNTYHFPDVVISLLTDHLDSPFVVEVISPLAGSLRINPLFREAVHQAPPEKAEQWQADLEQASLLVKCLQQRNHTLVRLMQQLSVIQRVHPMEMHLSPSPSQPGADISARVDDSGVIEQKRQLPNGRIIPLSKLTAACTSAPF